MNRFPRYGLLAFGLGLAFLSPLVAQGPSEFDVPSDIQILFIDKGDGGDDPMAPGCHYHYGDDGCSAPEFFFSGDYCGPDGKTLFEWTNPRCHEPEDDRKKYDCNKVCQKRFGVPGRCVTHRRHCRVPRGGQPSSGDSAACECKEAGS